MIFRRKIYEELLEWKRTSRRRSVPLIEGARRVGKSTVAEEFAKNEFDSYMILDFAVEGEDVRRNFEENLGDPDAFFRNLFLFKGRRLEGEECLIIFDEVQLFPKARQAVKYLVRDGRYSYIETGSLISIRKNVKDILIPSEERKLKMFPMDFEEFLWAKGDCVAMPAAREAFAARKPLGDAVHRRIMSDFRNYMAVGGMPQAVEAFTEGRTFREIDGVKRDILSLYEDDLKKYDDAAHRNASALFRNIPSQLANRRSHFRMASVGGNARCREYAGSVAFLEESMICNVCVNVTAPEISLELYADRTDFKIYLGDTGLLVTQIMKNSRDAEEGVYKALVAGRLGINRGMVFENMAAQMLRSRGRGLFFHEFRHRADGCLRENRYEIDFLLVNGKKVSPVEVKSSGYRSRKSFDCFREKYGRKTGERVILYSKDLRTEGDVVCLPLYMAPLL